MKDIIYELKDVSKTYMMNNIEVKALQKINLEINICECLAFIGPSGSGKSTILHLLGTIDKPTEGNVFFKGKDVSDLNDKELSNIRSKQIGFIFQNFNLIPILSVYENIEYPLRINNIRIDKEKKEKTHNLIEEVGLKDHMKHKPGELSGGQRQRVAIARALVIDPAVILADEPTANLDSKTSGKIIRLIKELSKKHKSTVIFSTHDSEIMKFVEKRIILNDGKIASIKTNNYYPNDTDQSDQLNKVKVYGG